MSSRTSYYIFLLISQLLIFFLITNYPVYFWPIIIIGDLIISFVLNYLSYPAGFRDKCWTDKDFHKRVFITFGFWMLLSVLINFAM